MTASSFVLDGFLQMIEDEDDDEDDVNHGPR